jgi:hypothetical protein
MLLRLLRILTLPALFSAYTPMFRGGEAPTLMHAFKMKYHGIDGSSRYSQRRLILTSDPLMESSERL